MDLFLPALNFYIVRLLTKDEPGDNIELYRRVLVKNCKTNLTLFILFF